MRMRAANAMLLHLCCTTWGVLLYNRDLVPVRCSSSSSSSSIASIGGSSSSSAFSFRHHSASFFTARRFLKCVFFFEKKNYFVYDPSAGSPTETLLRLLLPLKDQVRPSFSLAVS